MPLVKGFYHNLLTVAFKALNNHLKTNTKHRLALGSYELARPLSRSLNSNNECNSFCDANLPVLYAFSVDFDAKMSSFIKISVKTSINRPHHYKPHKSQTTKQHKLKNLNEMKEKSGLRHTNIHRPNISLTF